ncbi:MAG: hypothetical protein WCS17_04055 [Prevotella sp.]
MTKHKRSGITPYAKRLQEINRTYDKFCLKNLSVHTLIDFTTHPENLSKMGLDTLRGKELKVNQQFAETKHPQLPSETFGKTLNQQDRLLAEYLQATEQLRKIFEMRQIELISYKGDLPTSFVYVEKEIARCISGCLTDVPEQKRNTSHIQSLVSLYKVVQILPDGSHSVSLHKVHLILQDNYKDSCFCKLLNILLAGFMGSEIKTIDF